MRLRGVVAAVALIVGLTMGDLHAQRVESNAKISDKVGLPYRLRVTARARCDDMAEAAMFRRGPDGTEQVVWRASLLNNPECDPASGWFATLGNECSYALEHAVVVYDATGRAVRDLRVSDVLEIDERKRIGFVERAGAPRTLGEDERTGSDVWRTAGRIVFTPDGVWLTHPRLERRVLLTRR